MKHFHLNSITSTQEYLMNNFDIVEEGLLVSCESQTAGKGRHNRTWIDVSGSLSFSFSLHQSEVMTLTSLEVPVLIRRFFKKIYQEDILFKWPNDLINTEGEKCGGILINKQGDQDMIVGVGLNINPLQQEYPVEYTIGSIAKSELNFSKEELAKNLYTFILDHRLSTEAILAEWNQFCVHQNKEVKLTDNNEEVLGIFLGIGSNGQARLQVDNTEQEFYSGSLTF